MTDLLVVCGLGREAALVAGPGITTIAGGGDRAALEVRLGELDPALIGAVLSFGLAGALDPPLTVESVLLPEAVVSFDHDRTRYPVSSDLGASLMAALDRRGIMIAHRSPIAGSDRAVATAGAKAGLRNRTGATAVDMESHIAAAWAERHAKPFAVLRTVSDAADRDLPPAALAAMGAGGRIDMPAILRSLLREPGQIPALLGLARDGARAFRVLGRLGAAVREVALSSRR